MAAIEDILERATIKFPNPLGLADTERLLLCISEGVKGKVNYGLRTPKSFVYNEEKGKSEVDVRKNIIGEIIIRGSKNPIGEAVSILPSEDLADERFIKYSSMRFSIIPGYDVSEYRKETVQLWDDVRSIVEKYFSEH
jgi:hypothetical protein